MNLKDFFFPKPEQPVEKRSTLAYPDNDLYLALGATSTAAGVSVTVDKALRIAAVMSAVRVIAESAGSLPLKLYEKNGNTRTVVTDDPRARMISLTPNETQTSAKMWETTFGHIALWGNAFILKDINPATGFTTALFALAPDRTTPVRLSNGKVAYKFLDYEGKETVFFSDEVIHISGFGTGEMGLSPIGMQRETLATALAAEDYAARFFSNDARPGGAITIPGNMTEDQAKEYVRKYEAIHKGLGNSHRLALLTNGATWTDVGIPPIEAQFIEQRKFSTRQIATMFRVPPFMIGDMEPGSVSYASVQEQNRHFVVHCLTPYLTRVEQALNVWLFGSEVDQERGLYVKFEVDALLRGDAKSRADFYHLALTDGYMSRNEVRELEDMNPVDGLDEFLSMANMQKDEPNEEPIDESDNDRT